MRKSASVAGPAAAVPSPKPLLHVAGGPRAKGKVSRKAPNPLVLNPLGLNPLVLMLLVLYRRAANPPKAEAHSFRSPVGPGHRSAGMIPGIMCSR
jgi:hypothetical protein